MSTGRAWTRSSRRRSCPRTATRARSSPRCSPASAGPSSTIGRGSARHRRRRAGRGALLRTVAVAARRAVARPVAGTILTVADAAAAAAERGRSASHLDDALAVAEAAQQGAHEALARTPEQLDVLATAGVVDAGGQAYVLLIDVLVEVLGGPAARPLAPSAAPPPRRSADCSPPREYEVMYALRGAARRGLAALREELSVLGHSVVVVGDEAVAQVHVHLAEAGAAVEAALAGARSARCGSPPLPSGVDPVRAARCSPSSPAPGWPRPSRRSAVFRCAAAGGQLTLEELTAAADTTSATWSCCPTTWRRLEIARHLARSCAPGPPDRGHPDRGPGPGAGRDGRARADAPTSTRPWSR